MIPGLEFTRRRGGPGGTGNGAVDLSEIRRSEELINRLAARGTEAGPAGFGAERRAGGPGGSLARGGKPAGSGGSLARDGKPGGSGGSSPRVNTFSADPAAALLAALSADVDVPALQDVPAIPPARAPLRAAAWPAVAVPPSRGLAGWLRAAVGGALVAGLAGTTSLITASMLARLSRGVSGRGHAPSRGWAQPGRSRRHR